MKLILNILEGFPEMLLVLLLVTWFSLGLVRCLFSEEALDKDRA